MKKSTTAMPKHHGYLYGLAVDVSNPQTVIVSASQWARQAHFLEAAESLIYRRESSSSAQDENIDNVTEEWKLVSNGLPKPTGTHEGFRVHSTLSTIVEYSTLLIQVFHGKCLMT
ncbi:MAG: hypothetical protein M3247_08410 [Thermoproteota archaeon]|nr:hypothetical protein [Thermoproteota archaeon]